MTAGGGLSRKRDLRAGRQVVKRGTLASRRGVLASRRSHAGVLGRARLARGARLLQAAASGAGGGVCGRAFECGVAHGLARRECERGRDAGRGADGRVRETPSRPGKLAAAAHETEAVGTWGC
eukprot:6206324-Pleurochrysis_carterae.AAC.3